MKEVKRCRYEHCLKVVEGRKQFCSKEHRVYYWILEKRRKMKLKKEKDSYRKMIEMTKLNMSETQLELYKKLYG